MCMATSASQKSLSGCYRPLTACLFMNFCRQGCSTSCCTTSKLKGGHHCTIRRKRLFLMMPLRAFFGCQLVQSLRGVPSIGRTWLTCESLDGIGTCMECMPKNAFQATAPKKCPLTVLWVMALHSDSYVGIITSRDIAIPPPLFSHRIHRDNGSCRPGREIRCPAGFSFLQCTCHE